MKWLVLYSNHQEWMKRRFLLMSATQVNSKLIKSFKNTLRLSQRNLDNLCIYLKVVSATFLLVCFVCLKKSTCETRKNVFYFTSKASQKFHFPIEVVLNPLETQKGLELVFWQQFL